MPAPLPPDLKKAARLLESRLRLLGAPTTTEPMEKWQALFEGARAKVPPWLPTLLSRYSLGGVQLEFPHPLVYDEPPTFLSFLLPDAYEDASFLCELSELPDLGCHGFAHESNRDFWVTSIVAGPAGDVFLLDVSGWDGSLPTVKSGLKHAYTSLAPLLSIAAIGKAGGEDWTGYAIWYQEPEEVSEYSLIATNADIRGLCAATEGRIADALAAYTECERNLKLIEEKYPIAFNRHRQASLREVTQEIARLRNLFP